MTKNEYLEELKKELKKYNVADIDEIIADYEEHFNYKSEEGKTEEEIVRKLSSPENLAKEYSKIDAHVNKFEKNTKITGLTFLSVPVFMAYIFVLASVIVLGVFSLVSAVTGFCLITGLNIAGLLPQMPYFPAFAMGIAFFGLTILTAIGTVYLFLYAKQWGKAYLRWCNNIANNSHYPSVALVPKLSKKYAHKLKLATMIGLVCFVSAFVIGYTSMCIIAKSLEPWHVWHWFI